MKHRQRRALRELQGHVRQVRRVVAVQVEEALSEKKLSKAFKRGPRVALGARSDQGREKRC